jgi:hypothetical protein
MARGAPIQWRFREGEPLDLRQRIIAVAAAPIALAALLIAAPAGAADGEGFRFLPAVSLQLEAARYQPVETDVHWTGTMGGGADVFAIGGLRGYIQGDVETIIGNTRRGFDATQANYTLETGAWWYVHALAVRPYFHHVSRHLVDRSKPPAVDWNILGVGGDATLGAQRRVRIGGGIGHTTLDSIVGYRWEVIGHADYEVHRGASAILYGAARARLVTIEAEPELPRGDFVDFAVEGGVRLRRESRLFEAFAAFERRNDVFLLSPGARDRGLFGIRIRLPPEYER